MITLKTNLGFVNEWQIRSWAGSGFQKVLMPALNPYARSSGGIRAGIQEISISQLCAKSFQPFKKNKEFRGHYSSQVVTTAQIDEIG